MRTEREKKAAAEAAAQLVEDGMSVGLGSGSTVAYLLPALAARGLGVRCVATSPATEDAARALGLTVEAFSGPEALPRLDIAIDGADQVDPAGWLVKGGGGAHTREKAVAAAAERFVVIVSSDKLVERIAPPIPLELLEFGLAGTLERLESVVLRPAPRSPDGGVIADYTGDVEAADELAARLSATVGVVDHGLFPPALVSDVLVARGDEVEARRLRLALDELDAVVVRVADEADPGAALAHLVRRPLRLDSVVVLQGAERGVEVVHADGDVAVPRSELVRAAVVVVRQLEHVLLIADREEVVGRLELAVPDDVHVAREAKAERLVEAAAPLRVGDANHGVEKGGHGGILRSATPESETEASITNSPPDAHHTAGDDAREFRG